VPVSSLPVKTESVAVVSAAAETTPVVSEVVDAPVVLVAAAEVSLPVEAADVVLTDSSESSDADAAICETEAAEAETMESVVPAADSSDWLGAVDSADAAESWLP